MKTRLILWSLLLALPLTFSSCSSEEDALSLTEKVASDDAVEDIRAIFTDMHYVLGSIAEQYTPGELEEAARSMQSVNAQSEDECILRIAELRPVFLLLQDLNDVNLGLESKFAGYAALSTDERLSLLTEVIGVPAEAMSDPGDGTYPLCDSFWWIIAAVQIGFNIYCSNPPPQDVGFCLLWPFLDWLAGWTNEAMYGFCVNCIENPPCF